MNDQPVNLNLEIHIQPSWRRLPWHWFKARNKDTGVEAYGVPFLPNFMPGSVSRALDKVTAHD